MGWFSSPKCPHCGGKLTPTGYSFPFPQARCNNCVQRNAEKKKLEDRLKKLEDQLNKKKEV